MNLPKRLLCSAAFAVVTAPFLLIATACGSEHRSGNSLFGDMRVGSGTLLSQTRELPAFSSIEVDGSSDVEVQIGAAQQVAVTGDDNLLDMIDLTVRDGRLTVSSHGSYRSRRDLKVAITLPALDAVTIEGSGDVVLHGFAGSALKLRIAGSGDIHADGAVDTLALRIAGSGDADLSALKAKTAAVEINGSGDASVFASESLSAATNGSGDIRYSGDPKQLATAVHGSGDIRRF